MIVNKIKVQLGNREVIRKVSFSLSNCDKVGLVGINGAGKSTLLKALSNEIKIDSGSIKTDGSSIAYLKQEIPSDYNDYTIIDYIKMEIGIDVLEEKLHYLENNLNDNNMDEYNDVLNEYLVLDGYLFEDNLKNIISGLNLKKQPKSKIGTLSGGEKIKVLLAVLLLKNADILLLDEPTNNLDLEAIEWLENYLKSCNKSMIIISHDEVFLNNITNKIFELADGIIHEYNLSYDDYLIQKEIEYNQSKEQYEKAQEQVDRLKKQVQKAKEWANKGTNKKAHNDNDKLANNYAKEKTNSGAVSKLTKELEKIEIPKFYEKKPLKMFFSLDDSKGNKDISLNNLVCGYENFSTSIVNLTISFGMRVNIIGSNGSGKTTIINTILGKLSPKSGSITIGNGVKMGYISQNTLENDSQDTIYDYITKEIETVDKTLMFTLLDKFNISYDDRFKPYNLLSPGERTRVNLAKMALNNTNVIILDEVTNHLDKDALDLIYELIESYEGTIISVSHNRKYNEKLDADIELDIKTGTINLRKNLKK